MTDLDLVFAEEEYDRAGGGGGGGVPVVCMYMHVCVCVCVCDMGCECPYNVYFCIHVLSQVVPLMDKGDKIKVTNQNKMEYLNLLAQHQLAKSVKEEVKHFKKGQSLPYM